MTDRPLDRAVVSLRSLLDALPEPSLIVANGRIEISNRAAREILGEWIDGQDVRLAIRHPAAVERLLGSNGTDEVELAGIGSAERRWMMNVRALENGAKFVRLTDRSESYAAEQMRVDFVANASHELRTPLATLVGYAETLREQGGDIDSSTRDRFTGIIHDEARRMQRLVEDLISLSRIEAERFSPLPEAIELLPLIEEAIENCRNSAAARACQVRLETPQQLPPIVGDVMTRFSGWADDNRSSINRLADATGLMVNDTISHLGRLVNWVNQNQWIFRLFEFMNPSFLIAGTAGRALGTHYKGRLDQDTSVRVPLSGGQALVADTGALASQFGYKPPKGPKGPKAPAELSAAAKSIIAAADRIGISPLDFATLLLYEGAGSLSTSKWGGKGGKYLGPMQMGPWEQNHYGVKPGMSLDAYLGKATQFLTDRGVRAGDDLLTLYKAVNGGNVNVSANASDGNGTIRSHVEKMIRDRRPQAQAMFKGFSADSKSVADDVQRMMEQASNDLTKQVREQLLDGAIEAWEQMGLIPNDRMLAEFQKRFAEINRSKGEAQATIAETPRCAERTHRSRLRTGAGYSRRSSTAR